ncbi:uncharacterized protein LOC144159983 [Haemaphysalis longicornis]
MTHALSAAVSPPDHVARRVHASLVTVESEAGPPPLIVGWEREALCRDWPAGSGHPTDIAKRAALLYRVPKVKRARLTSFRVTELAGTKPLAEPMTAKDEPTASIKAMSSSESCPSEMQPAPDDERLLLCYMTARCSSSLLLLAGATLILKFCGCATAVCLPEYTKTSEDVVHTACKQPNRSCVVVKSGLSAADKQILLDTHNKYRSQIAKGKLGRFPPARDMLRLMWDDEMANNAQALAELCQSNHDKLQERFTTKFQQTGQNIGWSDDPLERTDVQASTWVDSWVDEHTDYAGSVSSFDTTRSKGVVTHFVQVAWAKTRFVGCGYVQHQLSRDLFKYQTIVICNYGEWGNQIGSPIYLEGATCSQCPSGTACDQPSGLCVAFEDAGGVGGEGLAHGKEGHRPPDGGRQRLDGARQTPPDDDRRYHTGGGVGHRPGSDGGGRGYPGDDGSQPGNDGGYTDFAGGGEQTPSGDDRDDHDGNDDLPEGHGSEVYKRGSVTGTGLADIFWAPLGFVFGTVFGASTVVAIFRFRGRKSEAGAGAGAAGDGHERGVTTIVHSSVQ